MHPAFVELTRTPHDWSHRMSKYLALATHLTPKYNRLPDRYKLQLDLLSKPIPIDESQPSSVQASAVSEFFNNASPEELLSIPIVHTDSGCITRAGSQRGSIGVYWGPASTFNLSQLATIGHFTNQRAELEAVLMALRQAEKRGMTKLILITDSAYAVDCLTLHHNTWI